MKEDWFAVESDITDLVLLGNNKQKFVEAGFGEDPRRKICEIVFLDANDS